MRVICPPQDKWAKRFLQVKIVASSENDLLFSHFCVLVTQNISCFSVPTNNQNVYKIYDVNIYNFLIRILESIKKFFPGGTKNGNFKKINDEIFYSIVRPKVWQHIYDPVVAIPDSIGFYKSTQRMILFSSEYSYFAKLLSHFSYPHFLLHFEYS